MTQDRNGGASILFSLCFLYKSRFLTFYLSILKVRHHPEWLAWIKKLAKSFVFRERLRFSTSICRQYAHLGKNYSWNAISNFGSLLTLGDVELWVCVVYCGKQSNCKAYHCCQKCTAVHRKMVGINPSPPLGIQTFGDLQLCQRRVLLLQNP